MYDSCVKNGQATYNEDGEQLEFGLTEDGDVIVEDQANGNEVTRISANPEDENDLVLSAVDVENSVEDPKGEEEAFCGDRAYSVDNLPSVEITRLPGEDGEHADGEEILPNVDVNINTGIDDNDKSGTVQYSMKFKNYSEKGAKRLAKIFSEVVSPLDKIVSEANVDEDVVVDVKEDGTIKVMSITIGTKKFSEDVEFVVIVDYVGPMYDAHACKSIEGVKKYFYPGRNPQEVLVVKAGMANTIAKDLRDGRPDWDEVYKSDILGSYDSWFELSKRFSDSTEDPTEAPTEEPTEAPVEDPKAEADSLMEKANDLVEKVGEGVTKENAPEVKAAAEEILTAAEALESKGCNMRMLKLMCNKFSEDAAAVMDEEEVVVEDPTESPTEEPTEEPTDAAFCGNQRSFSEGDPKVTVTVENLEPASVASLLKPAGVMEEPEADPMEPKVNPNEGEGRQFSAIKKETGINPLLHVEF